MKNPLEITFHDLTRNAKIEELIQGKFEKLSKLRPDITKCHVFLEKQSKHHIKNNSTVVRIDVKVPRLQDIIVSEKCSEDVEAVKSTIIKVFKRGQDQLQETIKYQREKSRVGGRKLVADNVGADDDTDTDGE